MAGTTTATPLETAPRQKHPPGACSARGQTMAWVGGRRGHRSPRADQVAQKTLFRSVLRRFRLVDGLCDYADAFTCKPGEKPNSFVAMYDAALPGTLPVRDACVSGVTFSAHMHTRRL